MGMISSPFITVIIPTYNSSGTLKLALETVAHQTYQDFEIWVVGDGCTDDSQQVVDSFHQDRFYWLNLPQNSGTPSKPRNEALKKAKGEYIAYLGHDDLWFPWHLQGLLKHIRQTECDFVYSLGAVIGPEGVVSFFSLPDNLESQHGGLSPSNWMHKRSLIEAIGPWSLKTKVSDDQEFVKRLWVHQVKIGFYREISALKFPAVFWKMYSRSSDFPQSEYVLAMNRDPAALRQRILLNFVSQLSKHYGGLRERNRITAPLFNIVRFVLRRYGYNRWPLNHLLYRRYRRKAGLP